MITRFYILRPLKSHDFVVCLTVLGLPQPQNREISSDKTIEIDDLTTKSLEKIMNLTIWESHRLRALYT